MASRTLPGVGLVAGYNSGEDGWGAAMNQNMILMSALTQLTAINLVTELPMFPSDGEIYLLSNTAAANPTMIAIRDDGIWRYVQPKIGWTAWATVPGIAYRFQSGNWQPIATAASLPSFGPVQSTYNLAVNEDGTGVRWVPPYNPPYQLPLFSDSGADDGKILSIVPGDPGDPSELAWVNPPTSIPAIPASSAGKVVVVAQSGTALTYEEDGKYKAAAPGYVLTDTDFSGRIIIGAAGNITIPAGLTRGSTVTIVRASANEVEILPASGVTLNVADGRSSLRARYSAVSIVKTANNTYVMFGDVTQGT